MPKYLNELGKLVGHSHQTRHSILHIAALCLRPEVHGSICSTRWSCSLHNPGASTRLEHLQAHYRDIYPRVISSPQHISCRTFTERFKNLHHGQEWDNAQVTLHGRISGLRSLGSRLCFVDIRQDGQQVQTICNLAQLPTPEDDYTRFKQSIKNLQIGDNLKVQGVAHRTASGELSLLLERLPQIVSPCLPPLPIGLQNKETRIRRRHVDFIVNPDAAALIRVRSIITQYVRQYLLADGQLEVQTPVLAGEAGGATARAFETTATEFADRKLALRIAPELWLKRLIIGGFDRIFEIGPSFRNEGIDLTHNPEFTTCEFYRAHTDITELMALTENLLVGLAAHLQSLVRDGMVPYMKPSLDFKAPFRTIDFLPALETAMERPLPDLSHWKAEASVKSLMQDLSIRLPEQPSLPAMLDRLCAIYLEPQCQQPTFVINHPECLSPLAKSFDHPVLLQRVAARAELFVGSTEIANMYEEENSPSEQRRKFASQAQSCSVDEEYLEALEWGLPPTGGWGAGIDRLCMLMTGVERISDTLTFGSLRNVVGRRTVHSSLCNIAQQKPK